MGGYFPLRAQHSLVSSLSQVDTHRDSAFRSSARPGVARVLGPPAEVLGHVHR